MPIIPKRGQNCTPKHTTKPWRLRRTGRLPSAMPMLRRTHDRYRGVRTVKAVARAAGQYGSGSGDRPMTRDGMIQPPAGSAKPLIVPAVPRGGATKQPPPRFPTAVVPSLTPAENGNPHNLHLWPAGSFLGDFRTPDGARNSSRKRNGSFPPSVSIRRLRAEGPKHVIRRSIERRSPIVAGAHAPFEGFGYLMVVKIVRERDAHRKQLGSAQSHRTPRRSLSFIKTA